MINKIILLGNVGKDAELKDVGQSKLCKFSVATSKKIKDEKKTTWHNVVVWGKLADICGQYVKKGMQVYVEGELEINEYEKDGVKKQQYQVRADQVQFLSSAKEKSGEF